MGIKQFDVKLWDGFLDSFIRFKDNLVYKLNLDSIRLCYPREK